MNKPLKIPVLFVFLLTLFAKPAQANCGNWMDPMLGTCPAGTTDCQTVTGAHPTKFLLCCDTSTECKQAPTPPPGGTAGGGIKPTVCHPGLPDEGIETALGCIPTTYPNEFAAWFLKLAIGIGGGI